MRTQIRRALTVALAASSLLACVAPRQGLLPIDQSDAATATTTADAGQGDALLPANTPDAGTPVPDTAPNAVPDAGAPDASPPPPDVAIMPDGPPACTNACTVGTSQCGPNSGTQACVTMATGCTAYAAEMTCPATRSCVLRGSGASCECATTCTLNSRKCGTSGGVQQCVSQGGCTTWGAETACQPPPNGSATCTGSDCAVTCKSGYFSCSDGTCGAKARTFESGAVEGVYQDPSFNGIFTGPLAVRSFGAGKALAADVKFQGINTVMWLRVPLCPGVSGASLRGKSFRAKVFLDGPATPPPDFGFGAAALLPDGWGGIAELSSLSVHFNETLQGTFPDVEYSDRVNELIISVGSKGNTGSGWAGTVFVDDIQID